MSEAALCLFSEGCALETLSSVLMCNAFVPRFWHAHVLAGDALFQTHENLEHLAMMEQVLGPIPEGMVERSNKAASKCFVEKRCVLL